MFTFSSSYPHKRFDERLIDILTKTPIIHDGTARIGKIWPEPKTAWLLMSLKNNQTRSFWETKYKKDLCSWISKQRLWEVSAVISLMLNRRHSTANNCSVMKSNTFNLMVNISKYQKAVQPLSGLFYFRSNTLLESINRNATSGPDGLEAGLT